MTSSGNLNGIRVWATENNEKTTNPFRWDHDLLICAARAVSLHPIEDTTVIIPFIFDTDLESIASMELYDGVYEYKIEGLTVEVVSGFEYSEYKIYGAVDTDEIIKRLTSGGAVNVKPDIPIVVPDRPPVLDDDVVNQKRYDYTEELLEKDVIRAKNETIKSFAKNISSFIFVGLFLGFVGYEIFVPKLQDITPDPGGYISSEGSYIFYSVEKRLHVYKLAEPASDVGYDSTFTMLIGESVTVGRKVVIDRLVDVNGNIAYERGNRIVDFESNPTDFEFINGMPFTFDGYGNNGPEDWSGLGELEKGEAEKIILRGKLKVVEGNYVLVLGRTYALLGAANEETPPFWNVIEDDISLGAIQYSLKADQMIQIYGQIQKTLTSREGRNSAQRIIFSFKTDMARPR